MLCEGKGEYGTGAVIKEKGCVVVVRNGIIRNGIILVKRGGRLVGGKMGKTRGARSGVEKCKHTEVGRLGGNEARMGRENGREWADNETGEVPNAGIRS
jgi:hypothetical protein